MKKKTTGSKKVKSMKSQVKKLKSLKGGIIQTEGEGAYFVDPKGKTSIRASVSKPSLAVRKLVKK